MQPWKTLSKRLLADYSKFLSVEEHTIELPDGSVIPDWHWVVTPDYINVVVETEAKDFLFFRQTKYGVEGVLLAPIGGYIEPGEAPLAAAKRELCEETGYAAREWISLGNYRVDCNRGAGMAHLFLARGAYQVSEPDADDIEEQVLLRLSGDQMAAALKNGEFKVLPWAMVVALSLLHLGEGENTL